MKIHAKILCVLSLLSVAGTWQKAWASQYPALEFIEKSLNTIKDSKMITEKWIKEAIPELRRLDIAILEKVALLESLNKQTNENKNIPIEARNLEFLKNEHAKIYDTYVHSIETLKGLDHELNNLMAMEIEMREKIKKEEKELEQKMAIKEKKEFSSVDYFTEEIKKLKLQKSEAVVDKKKKENNEELKNEDNGHTIQDIGDLEADGPLLKDKDLGIVGKNTLEKSLNALKSKKEELTRLSTPSNLKKPESYEQREKLFKEIQELRDAISKLRNK
jgi:hypothetical protein